MQQQIHVLSFEFGIWDLSPGGGRVSSRAATASIWILIPVPKGYNQNSWGPITHYSFWKRNSWGLTPQSHPTARCGYTHLNDISSSTERSISLAICLRRIGEMSCPWWKGTEVPLPSGCRYCLWEPFWRTWTKPSLSRIETTSLGLRTGSFAIIRSLIHFEYRWNRHRVWVRHPRGASRWPRAD